MLLNIWVKDKSNGYIHQVGTNAHDSLELIDGKVEYIDLQCMCGTLDGEYVFVESGSADDDIWVEQVRHGKWQPCYEDWRKQIEGDECSACGFQHYGTNIRDYPYCPNCGARMDGETNDG